MFALQNSVNARNVNAMVACDSHANFACDRRVCKPALWVCISVSAYAYVYAHMMEYFS